MMWIFFVFLFLCVCSWRLKNDVHGIVQSRAKTEDKEKESEEARGGGG